MISGAVVEALQRYVPRDNIHLQEPMAGHTTFRIGGPADCFVQLEDEEQLRKVRRYLGLAGVPFFVLGNGSNLLVDDAGYRGVVLQIGQKMSDISVQGCHIIAKAGATLRQVAAAALEHGLAGFEFASGIPGTVGGGVVMNAGAYGGEMSQVVNQVRVVSKEGESMELDNDTMEFRYRGSVIRGSAFTVTEVTFRLEPGDREAIRAKMEELAARRREKQPLEYPSAGSTFKRPEGHFAGKLIMEAGFAGYRIGGAQVSEKHCGFVINTGDATARDVRALIEEIQARVKERFRVDLEPEIVFLG
ncbi:UDP-N-acetylmuramate dehydrogenase [uncultured Acetatifactor sp.]|jgi:UDP-N-acetylmuramate dehydrogenase|uniref:UDP-N-acetylmuramate dehydrogenase n=1 Tax=uncultured Acetatifactor sp. TaxID=1671927 RepID=UPI0025EE42E6|nr:UDP-N-acetylmuramate dehydrogenase [uncultured Acetatifactor sp.]MCI8696242.1 UDP-N-acetylmuramate dehydrogenase [Lachnospiraceae bacterium]MCI9232760.1 UDP-N-acetylmuramate dehydrogenase [Lachnospiraceae bacterium]